jgi:DNA-binding transcriptional regulator YiaG
MLDVEPVRIPTATEVRAMRAAVGASVRSFASLVGVGHMSISRWERGEVAPSRDNARKLFAAMDRQTSHPVAKPT